MGQLLIPKIFHVMWHGDKPMPIEFVEYGKSWLYYNPGWKMKLWNSENMIKLQNQEFYDKATLFAQKADIARYEIIYNFGGVYIDADFECLKNIEELLDNVEAFCAYQEANIVEIAIMGCIPKNPVFKMLIDGIPESIKRYKKRSILYQTGPMYATKKLRDRKDITIFNPELFYPDISNKKQRDNDAFSKAYAVHHFANTWIKELSKNFINSKNGNKN